MVRIFYTTTITSFIFIISGFMVFNSSPKKICDNSFTCPIIDSVNKNSIFPDTIILERNLSGSITKFRINYSDSIYKIYWKDGVFDYISDIHSYKNNKAHGMQQTFAPNGVLIHEVPWVAGKIVGVESFWKEDGKLDWTRTYNDLGLLSDSIVTYYKSGQISSSLPYENGKLNGVGRAYDVNGNIKQKSFYSFDTLKRTEYYENNILIKDSLINLYNPY